MFRKSYVAVALLAACTGAQGGNQVEIFSWWTGGGEAAGLEAMLGVFGTEYPNVEFINSAVAGGAGTNARAVLASRLQAGDPPDSWQAHAGQEIIGTYVAAGQIEPLNSPLEGAMGEKWTAMQLREVVLLGPLGPDGYSALGDGTGDWGSADVTAALEAYSQVLQHVNSDASGHTWQDASQLVANGDAA